MLVLLSYENPKSKMTNESLVILDLERIVMIWKGKAKQNSQVTIIKIRKKQKQAFSGRVHFSLAQRLAMDS